MLPIFQRAMQFIAQIGFVAFCTFLRHFAGLLEMFFLPNGRTGTGMDGCGLGRLWVGLFLAASFGFKPGKSAVAADLASAVHDVFGTDHVARSVSSGFARLTESW